MTRVNFVQSLQINIFFSTSLSFEANFNKKFRPEMFGEYFLGGGVRKKIAATNLKIYFLVRKKEFFLLCA